MDKRRLILPIFIPHHGCPHRCVYCDQGMIAEPASPLPTPQQIVLKVERCLMLRGGIKGANALIQVAIYGGNFTSLPQRTQEGLLAALASLRVRGVINSLRISTRPDRITDDSLTRLKEYAVETIELGVHSLDDRVLTLSQRGYGKKEVREIFFALKAMGFEVGMQLMVGLPGDTQETFASTISEVIEMNPDFVRIYPTIVLKGTVLEDWFHKGKYRPLTLYEAIAITKKALRRLEAARIPVIRVGLQPNPSLEAPGAIVAGPYHPAFRELVQSAILYEEAVSLVQRYSLQGARDVTFCISPKDISAFYGKARGNIERLKATCGLHEIKVRTDPKLPRGTVTLVSKARG